MDKIKNTHLILEGIEYKICSKCSKLKTLDNFSNNNTSRDNLQAWCKKCNKFIYSSTPYYKLRWTVLLRDNFKCQYCGNTAKDCRLCIDHIKAKSKGGKDTMDNLITSCEFCNLGKADVLLSAHDIAKIKALRGNT